MKNSRTLKATENNSAKTFTLRVIDEKGRLTKYRTNPMDKEEFSSCQSNTQNDWFQFLKSCDYYLVK